LIDINKTIRLTSLIAVCLLSLAAIVTIVFLIFVKSESTAPLSIYLDPDSTDATFTQDTITNVSVIIKNNTNSAVSITGYTLTLEADASLVDLKVVKTFSPIAGWAWSPSSGFTQNILTLTGASPNGLTIEANQTKQVGLLTIAPKASFDIKFRKDMSAIVGRNGKGYLNNDLTPDSQPYHLTGK
jgi:hypothetical protein